MTTDEIDCSEEGGTEPAIAMLPRLVRWPSTFTGLADRPR